MPIGKAIDVEANLVRNRSPINGEKTRKREQAEQIDYVYQAARVRE